jgi:outer membrane protein assembly factor BamB
LANSGKLDSYELLNETIFASPSLHKDVLYLSTWDGEVIAFDYRKKEVKWKEKISSSPLGSTPAISQNNKIYLGSFFWSSYGSYKIDDSKVIYEVDSNTGNLDWSYDLDTSLVLNSTGYIYDVASSPIITDNGHIYITYEHSVHKFVGASSPPIDASWPMNNRNSQQTSQMPLIQDGWKFLNGDSWMYSANSKSWQYLHASSEHLHMLDIANNHWSTILDGEEIIGSRYIDGYNQAVQDIVSKPDQFQLYDSEDLEKANENSWSNGYNDGLKFEDFAPISLNNRTVIFQYDSGLVSRVRFYSDGLNGAYNNINSSGNILYLYSPTSSKEASITINTPSEIIQGNVTFKNPNRGTFAGTIKIIATGSISNLSAVFKFL